MANRQNLVERVQNSERFLRVHEAEAKMVDQQKKNKQKRLKLLEDERNGLAYTSQKRTQYRSINSGNGLKDEDEENHETELFTAHTLNKDPEVSKYLLFNEIIYPKLFTKKISNDSKEEIEKVWVSGFLDRSIRDKNKPERLLRKGKLKSISSSFLQNDDSSSVASSGDLSGSPTVVSNQSLISKPKFDPSIDRPTPMVSTRPHRSDAKRAMEAMKAPSFEPDDATSSLSVNDKYRLKLLTNSIKSHEKQKKKISKQLIQSLKVYETQNRVMKQSSLQTKLQPSIHSLELDSIFETERIESLAAKKIERAYVHSCVIAKLRHVFRCMLMAVRIQKIIRGILARKRVAEWYQKKSALMIQWQCRVRRYLSNLHLSVVLHNEKTAAVKIQTIIRRKLASLKLFKLRQNFAITRIQCLWRGCCARIRADRLWLNRVVIPIQVLLRKMVSRMKYDSIKSERNGAALMIQRCFRSWFSTQKLSTSLNNREDIYREYTMAMLTAEEEWADDTIAKLSHRLEKKEVREKLSVVIADYQQSLEDIHFKENDHIELSRQRDVLSARAIQQGWLAELDQNITATRNELTSLKMKLVFKKHVLLNSFETQLTSKVKEIEEVARFRDMIADCRDQEIEDNRVRDFYRNTNKMRKLKKQAIAHERRKWMVHFYTPNGKPDKLRRPGRQWDPEAYAGPEKMTYCGGHGVDLLAMNKSKQSGAKGRGGAKEGSKESVEQRLNEVSLQTYLQQVQEYETLLDPLFKIMKSSMGGAPGHVHPSEAGWGPMGKCLPEALEEMGTIPKEWKEQRSELERNELRKQREMKRKQKILEDEEFLREQEKRMLLQNTDGLSAYNEFFDQDGEHQQEQQEQEQERGQGKGQGQGQDKGRELGKKKTQLLQERGSQVLPSSSIAKENDLLQKKTHTSLLRQRQQLHPTQQQDGGTLHQTEEERQRVERRKKRHRERHVGAAVIPWNLLDELDGEKKRFESEKSYLEFYHKF